MNQSMHSLLASLGFVLAFAPSAAAFGDEEWAGLDADLESLAQELAQPSANGPRLEGLLRARYAHLPNALTGSQDISGFSLDRTQVALEGMVDSRYGYRVQLEAAGGTAVLLDAMGTWNVNEYLRMTMGRFRSPLLWESQLDDGSILFLTRTDSGELFYGRSEGAMLEGRTELFHWAFALQNGVDSVADEYAMTARIDANVLGGGVGLNQGAYGAGDDTRLSVGAGYFDDAGAGSGNDATVLAFDAQFQMGRFAADAMVANFGDDNNVIFVNRADSSPWSAAASFMVLEELEAAVRYQEVDNLLDESDITFGVNYYAAGHDAKWQATAVRISSDDPDLDDTWRFGLGISVRI